MKSLFIGLISVIFLADAQAQINLDNIKNQVNNAIGNTGLSNTEIVSGLKEALKIGTNNSTGKASKPDGFFKNQAIKILFPPEARDMERTLRNVGMGPQVDKFVMTLNRAAEDAAKSAAPIFINAITGMSISDGLSILKGGDNAATNFLKNATQSQLIAAFKPTVKNSLTKVQITKYWNPLAKKYNKIPMVKKVNPNLDDYVTMKAIEGLFKLIAEEEFKIRKDPLARVTELLKKVFGGG
ncbi:MAG: DUF4197 domain-containing protein [Bacteroidetes bacterium]|nr:DUF4197 domain-containing protein [Bacteroidota bacterium]